MKSDKPERLAHLLSPHMGDLGIDPALGPDLVAVVEAQRERAKTLVELAAISAFYYKDFDEFDEKTAQKAFKAAAIEPLATAREKMAALAEWNREALHGCIHQTVEELGIGMGKLGMPLRLAATGGSPAPDLDLTLYLIGREATLRRIDRALEYIRLHGEQE
jgi:glutamyl-tRNA synthetase